MSCPEIRSCQRVGRASRPSARGTEKTGETPVPHFQPPLTNLKSSYPLTDTCSVREGLRRRPGLSLFALRAIGTRSRKRSHSRSDRQGTPPPLRTSSPPKYPAVATSPEAINIRIRYRQSPKRDIASLTTSLQMAKTSKRPKAGQTNL